MIERGRWNLAQPRSVANAAMASRTRCSVAAGDHAPGVAHAAAASNPPPPSDAIARLPASPAPHPSTWEGRAKGPVPHARPAPAAWRTARRTPPVRAGLGYNLG